MNRTGLDLMAEYVFLSKYSQRKENGILENWNETVDRIYGMHEVKLKELGLFNDLTKKALNKAKKFEYNKVILSSQRGRQFASSNKNSGILKHEAKMYNCSSTFIDRPKVFSEIMYLLLCGCGVGYSLHKEYIEKLPEVKEHTHTLPSVLFTIPDSIEGWADAIHYLMDGWFTGYQVNFNYSEIRPEGSLIDGKFVAPGAKPLHDAIVKINKIMQGAIGRKLQSIEIHDICCHIASAVVSGGVRRSAMIAMFDRDDELMLKCKTGNWWEENPQRAFANNSILTLQDENISYEEIKKTLSVVRQFGEPGFINVPSYDYVVNPCGEVVMKPTIDIEKNGKLVHETGFAFCNLVEINNKAIGDKEIFYEACESASFIATVQSLYIDFKYLGRASELIAERDRAIGVSITGFYENNNLNKYVLEIGARLVRSKNGMWANLFGISRSACCTTVKPSGNASCILGLTCSGIHPAHDHKYLRRIRIKTYSPEYIALKDTPMVKYLRGDEAVITFPIESGSSVKTKDEVFAVEHLKDIAMVKHFWINKGSVVKHMSNNVSSTVEVKENEWDEVAAVYYMNRHLFTGVTFLPSFGDAVYDNAPFQRLSNKELRKEYEEIEKYIKENDVDINAIMSNRDNLYSGDMVAQGCAGGACELK